MEGTTQAPLGELLVQHGGMSEEHLRAALEEQRTTGRPLGEIVVARGYVPAAMVAQALATQQGGLTKTEYGYATGWAQAVDERDRAIAELRHWAEGANAAIAARDAEIARLQGELASIDTQEAARLRDTLAEQTEVVRTAKTRVDEAEARVQVLEAELAAAAAFENEVAAANARTDDAQARIVALEAEARAANERVRALESELGDVRRQLEELHAAAAATRDPWANADAHLLFVRRAEGYELVERDGPPPAAGDVLDVGVVQRVSALGGTPCAYVID